MPARLFDESSLRKLEQLRLIATKVRAGVMKGERRSVKRGTSIEFADYRDYTRGDDLRRLDWNVYARLERPFIKLLEEEEDLTVHVLIDSSESMNWPQLPDRANHKFDYARRLAAALAHIGLAAGDRVRVSLLAGDRMVDQWGPSRGRAGTLRVLEWLEGITTGGTTELNPALKDYALRGGRPGLALLISDLLAPGGFDEGVNALLARGYETAIIHLLSPDEVNPDMSGDLRLIDSETGAPQDVTIDGSMRDLYLRRLREWRDEISARTRAQDQHYVSVETSTPWEQIILDNLRRVGVLR